MKKDIVIKGNGQIILPEFTEKAEKFDFILENEDKLMAIKMKHGKEFVTYSMSEDYMIGEIKAAEKTDINENATVLNVKSVINTTG